jgi:DNA-binding NtrC family response regulator
VTSLCAESAATERMFVSHDLLRDLSCAAQVDVPVLISAPTFEDCTQLAALIHRASRHGVRRFFTLSCGSVAPALLEAALFGTHGAPGLLDHGDGGTLLLGQVDALELDVQLRLHEYLESRTTRRVRLITATTRDLFAAVRCRRFLSGLFYRLNFIHVAVSPPADRS